jgi:histidinol dehydrogenase
MKTIIYQQGMDLDTILKRNEDEREDIRNAVLEIIKGVKKEGNAAL